MNGSPLLLPIGLRCAWIAVYVAILIVHIGHGASTRGATRAWHAGHCAMALAMAWMFVPRALAPLPAGIGQAAFGAIALVVARDWHRQRRLALGWVSSLIGALAMVYMFALPTAGVGPLTAALSAYFAAEGGAWLYCARALAMRLSLAAMAAGMAYMFLLMTLG